MKSLMEIFLGKRCNGGDMEKGRGEYNQSTAIVSATDERHTGDLRVTFGRPLGDLWATFGRPLEFYASSVRDCRDSRRAFTPIKIIPFIFLGALHRFMGKVALLAVLLMLGVGNVWGTDFTFSGAYDGTGNGSWNTTTLTTPIVTVTKDFSNASKKISCVNASNLSYPSLNAKGKYIKFSVPSGYRITNVNVTWMSNADEQQIVAVFGESISGPTSDVVTATNGGYVISSALAKSGNTSCDGGHDLVISSSHNAKEVMLIRAMAYNSTTYSSANTKYASFPCKMATSSGGDYPNFGGTSTTAYIGKVVLTVESTSGGGGGSSYDITYHCNGGATCPDNLTEQTALPNPLATLTMSNYTWGGWYTDAAFSSAASAGATLSADADLYAKFTQSITLDREGATTGSTSVTATYNSATLPSITNPTKDGYTFAGWYTDDDGTGTLVINTSGVLQANVSGYTGAGGIWTSSSARTLYAKWDEEECEYVNASITFDNNKSAKYNTAYNTSTDIATLGDLTYTLTNCSSDGGHPMTKPAIKGSKNTTLIQLNIPEAATSGTISVSACTYSGGAATLAITNSSGTVLASGSLKDYTINSPDGGSWTAPTLRTISYDITAGGTYYIKETSNSNNVYIYAFSATGINDCPSACDAAPAAPDGLAAGSVTANGVTFTITDDETPNSYDIYYSTSSTAPTSETSATTTTNSKTKAVTGLTANTTYYAWVRAVCDASHKSAWVALAGSSFTTSKATPTLYRVGASMEGECNSSVTAKITLSGSQTGVNYQLKKDGVNDGAAKAGTGSALEWTGKGSGVYTVWASGEDYSSLQMSRTVTVEKYVTAITTQPTTSVSADAGEEFTLGTGMVTEGLNKEYQWYSYTSAEGAGEAVIVGAESATYTTSKSAGTYYYKVQVSGDCGDPVKSNMITVTVVSAGSTYSITYNCNSAESGCPSNVAAATNLPNPLPSAPTKTGYTFGGWYTNEGLTDAAVAGASLEVNTTLYAKWCANHNVTWYVNGEEYTTGSPTTSTNECAGITTMPTAPSALTCSDSFRGWTATNLYGEAVNTPPSDLFTTTGGAPVIDGDKTFYAVFAETDAGDARTEEQKKETSFTSVFTSKAWADAGSLWTSGQDGSQLTSGQGVKVTTSVSGANATTKASYKGVKAVIVTYNTLADAGVGTIAIEVGGTAMTGSASVTKTGGTADRTISYTPSSADFLDGTVKITVTCTTNSIHIKSVQVIYSGYHNYRCQCPTLTLTGPTGDLVFITSAASKKVRSQEAFHVSGSNLTRGSGALTGDFGSSALNAKFAFKDANGDDVTTEADGSIDADLYVFYTPDAADTEDGLDVATAITVTVPGAGTATSNDLIASKAIKGRHLPANFVIAAKVSSTWYALPADHANGTPDPIEIAVDNTTTPTKGILSIDTHTYTLYGQTNTVISGGNGQYVKLAMHGQNNYPLFGSSGTGTSLGKSTGQYPTNDLSVDYWWLLTQTNASVSSVTDVKYNMTVANSNTKHVRIYNSKWGLYANGVDELRLLPFEYAITLDKNGGSADGLASVAPNGTSATIISAPTYEGYEVDYYMTDDGFAEVLNPDGSFYSTSAVDGSGHEYITDGKWVETTTPMSLKAHWVAAATYTVTYQYNGATGGASTPSATGLSVTLPTPTKTDYTFQGWYESSGTKAGDGGDTYNPAADLTLYALWRADCAGGGTTTLVDINFKDATWSGKTFSQGNTNDEDVINGVYFWAKNSSYQFSLEDNTTKGLTFPNNNISSNNFYFCIPLTGINASDKQITVTLKHGYSSNQATFKYCYVDGRTSFVDANTGGTSGTSVSDATSSATQMSFTKSSLTYTSGHLIIGRGSSSYKNIYGVTVTTPGDATCYYVTYNGNGADGGFTKDEAAHGSGSDVSIVTNGFTRTGYTFTGWNTAPGGGGTAYPANGTITGISADVTLYAQWSAGTMYSVTYNGNGNTGGTAPATASHAAGSNVTVLGNTGSLEKTGYTFDGWATANDGTGTSYAAGGTISSIAADVTLYAKWKQTVTLNTGLQGEGADKEPTVCFNGASLNGYSAHSVAGYELQGYYTASSGGTKVLNANGSFAAAAVTNYITDSKWSRTNTTTLYAQWRASAGSTCYEWDAEETKPRTGTDENFGGLYLTASTKTKVSFYSGHTADSCYSVSKASQILTGHLNGTEIGSVKFKASSSDASNNTFMISFGSTVPFDTAHIIQVSSKDYVVKTVNKNDAAASEYTVTAPAGTKSFAMGRNGSAPHLTGDDLKNSGSRYLYYLYVCSAGGGTHTISYNNGGGSGSMSSHTSIADNGSQTLTANSFTAPTNYTFAGWVADVAVTIGGDTKAAGTLIADESTITNITTDINLTAKWGLDLKLETGAQGSDADEDLTVYYNSTSITGHTPHTAGGYRLLGYYTASSSGDKVLNADGTFAGTSVSGYIADGKWTYTSASSLTLYGQWETSSLLKWNLQVNKSESPITTTSKESATARIITENMTNLDSVGLNITASKRGSLTSVISTPSLYDGDKYMKVTFQVANGYKLVPTAINVKIQPKGSDKYAKLELVDNAGTPHSISYTTASKLKEGTIHTVTLSNGEDVEFTGTVTLKIYCYGATDGYRLGTPIEINGAVEEACTMPSYTGLDYEQTEYTKDAAASAISVTGATDVTTYAWKQNTTNDRTGGSAASGTNNTASYTPLTSSTGTMYYWCELTNACGTVKTPTVAISVRADKTDPTVTWSNPGTVNYGGGNYTLRATVNETAWDGTLDVSMLTAPAGIRIYGATTGTSDSKKYIEVKFDVLTTFDRATYSSNIPFTLSLPETTNYDAVSLDHDVAYSSCSGAGEGTSYNIRVRKVASHIDNKYYWDNPDGWISPDPSNSIGSSKAGTKMGPDNEFDSIQSNNGKFVNIRSYHANISKVRIYADFRVNNMTVTNVYKHSDFFSADAKYEVDYSVVYNDDESADDLGTAAQGYVDITLNELMAENDIVLVKFNDSKVRPLGAVLTESSAGSLTTTLGWKSGKAPTDQSSWDGTNSKLVKTQSAANFTCAAEPITANTNTLGTITYSSSNTSCATVNATTGEVTITATGTSTLSTTITATLAASGCYKKATLSYTLEVTGQECTISSGGTLALTSGSASKCESATVTLTLSGYDTDGTTVTWYRDETDVTASVSDNTLTTSAAGSYSVLVSNGVCSKRSNSITITNKSAEAGATKLVDEWYIKQGRLTPDIALFELSGAKDGNEGWAMKTGGGADLSSIAGCSFERKGDIVYLHGYSTEGVGPTDIASAANETIKVVVSDACGGTTTSETIIIHKQVQTDKHVLAFVVTGTGKGGFTDGITAAQTTNVPLYNTLTENFDVQATNIYSTDDEKKLKEYYSQFDILCVTDYPNTGTKGVNKKSYVDALGALIDIRPILTMEAFVAKLANWKAKGISGTPESPSERQYSMLLQCKDHEIFAGTTLTKIGEGDEAMYRINMVDRTQEEYVSLDVNTPGTKAYNAGGKPALQGFTYTSDLKDLLPLGLIDDGSGNDLQVGIERQEEMEARLLVLGINSYAMERLTDDGEQVVVNALKYLMKKNAEDIADCSNYFIGGADGDADNWANTDNWSGNTLPDRTQKVRILAPCVIKAGTDPMPHVAGVVIVPNGQYNHGASEAEGSLTIAAGGSLIVDGKIEKAKAPYYYETQPTDPSNLILNTSSTAQSALILDNEDGKTQATINIYSKSNKVGSTRNWQYLAIPIQEASVSEFFYGVGTYTYKHIEAQGGWVRYGLGTTLNGFDGIGLTQPEAECQTYTFYGPLVDTDNHRFYPTYANEKESKRGTNIVGNSWTAPINLKALESTIETDASNLDLDIAIYNTGKDKKTDDEWDTPASRTEAGTWEHIPLTLAGVFGEDWAGATVIPAYQAFQIKATAADAMLNIDYERCVRNSVNADHVNDALRAPARRRVHNDDRQLLRIAVQDTIGIDYIYLIEGPEFTEGYDNGWEAAYSKGITFGKLYALDAEANKKMALARPDLEGTMVGFVPGVSNAYTITFNQTEGYYYLNDLKKEESTLIQKGNSYTFTVAEGDAAERFMISGTPFVKTNPTGVEEMENGKWKMENVRKVIYNDHLYIIRGGRIYGADGATVK